MKFYITGCAKTGTTLLRRLFTAFDLKVYNYDEITLDDFLASDFQVGKRTAGTLFSNIIPNEEEQVEKMKGIYIINCTRNKEDTLKSDNNWVSPERYDKCLEQAEKYKDLISFHVKYEDLIKNPNKIQDELAQKFNLTIKHKFTDYPDFIDLSQEREYTHGGRYTLRRIGGII